MEEPTHCITSGSEKKSDLPPPKNLTCHKFAFVLAFFHDNGEIDSSVRCIPAVP